MFCVVRVTDDGRWLWVWWFADTTIRGKLILERFSEYVATDVASNGLSQYVLTRNCVLVDGTLNLATVPLPDEVMTEAVVRVRRELSP